MSSLLVALSVALVAVSGVRAESHTVRFENNCGHGEPVLLHEGKVVSKGEPYTYNGALWASIAYLQTGQCLYNGENCGTVELSLAGVMSSVDISIIPPLAYNVPTSFEFEGACKGIGRVCDSPSCEMAFRVPDDNFVQQQCTKENADLLITFCPGGSSSSPQPSSSAKPTPTTSSTTARATPTTSSTTSTSSSSSSAAAPTSSAPASLPTSPVNRKVCKNGQARRAQRRSQHHRRAGYHH